MAVTPPQLLTVEEFSNLPEPRNAEIQELHGGRVVGFARPVMKYYLLQCHLRDLLEPHVPGGLIGIVFAFCPLPEYELRVADIAWLPEQLLQAVDLDGYVQGTPPLVIEVISPGKPAAIMAEREAICLQNGTQQFWQVEERRQQIRIATPDGQAITYRSGQAIPLGLFGGGVLSVDEIFDFRR